MTRDEILKIALACFTEGFFTHEVEEFAERIAAAEREACARLCEKQDGYHDAIYAEAIRARGQK